MLHHICDGHVRVGGHAAFVVDHHPPNGVRMNDPRRPKLQRRDSRLAEIEHHLLVGQVQKLPHRLHVQRRVQIPVVQIAGAAVGQYQQGLPHHPVRVRLDVEESRRAVPLAQRVAENFDIGLRALRQELVRVAESLDQVLQVALAGLRIGRAHLGKREIGEDVRVALQCLVVNALQVVFRVQEKIPQDHVAEALDGPRKLLVPVIFLAQPVEIGHHARVRLHALLLALQHGLSQLADGRRRFIRLAEGDVEGRDLRTVLAQRIERLREIRARKWPAPQDLLRALVDIHDDDARVGMRVALRPQAKSQIQRVQLQPVDEGKHRGGSVADEGLRVDRQRERRQADADSKGNPPLPPRLQPFTQGREGVTRCTARGSPRHDAGIVAEGAAKG